MADALAAYAACLGGINIIITAVVATIGLVRSSNCEQIIQKTFIWIAFALAIVSLICACCCFLPEAQRCNFYITTLIGLLFISYLIFGYTVTHKGSGEILPGKAYKEYRLNNYSHWLHHRVNNAKRWRGISSCLVHRHACKKMTKDWAYITVEQFYTKRLSSIESGCCKPSNDCNFSYVTPTNWTETVNSSYTNPDCNAWSNDVNIWCFNCQSCKAGVADRFKHKWVDILKLHS